MMEIRLPYGKKDIFLKLGGNIDAITGKELPSLENVYEKFLQALRSPLNCRPLREQVSTGDRIVIVHTDITRATPNHIVIPALIDELLDAGAEEKNITLLNATGSHRGQRRDELAMMLGTELVERFTVMQHDAFDPSGLVFTGRTESGNDIYLNRNYVEADLRIVTGFIEPHFFAGFSGGPKALLPGIAGIESIMANHCAAHINSPCATWGITTGNPLWEEIARAASFAMPHFCLNVTLNTDKGITGIFAGELFSAHAKGCAFVAEQAMVPVHQSYDIVITTNSGYPLDQNLYQAVKGLSAAAGITRKGGAIVMAAACQDGMPGHGNFRNILAGHADPNSLLRSLGPHTVPDQWQAQILAKILLHCNVYLYSYGLSDDDIKTAMIRRCSDIPQTVEKLRVEYGGHTRIAVMPDGPLTIPFIK